MKKIIAIIALAALSATSSATLSAAQTNIDHPSPEDMPLILDYFICSELAEIRLLSPPEVAGCVELYTQVKLSFLEDVDQSDFREMSARQRAEVNRRGYKAYNDWRQANPELVSEIEAEARAEITGPGA